MRLEFLFGSGLNTGQSGRLSSLLEHFHLIKFVQTKACSDTVFLSHFLLLSGAVGAIRMRNRKLMKNLALYMEEKHSVCCCKHPIANKHESSRPYLSQQSAAITLDCAPEPDLLSEKMPFLFCYLSEQNCFLYSQSTLFIYFEDCTLAEEVKCKPI